MAEASDSLQGGCACGAVRYRLGAAPMFVHCCHCRDCQRQTGSAFVLNALVETERVVLLAGEPVPVAVPTDSGRPHRIFRCPACQTAVWSEYGGAAKLRFVRVGTLDQPAVVMPDAYLCPLEAAVGEPARGRSRLRGLLRCAQAVAGGKPRAPARRSPVIVSHI
jgi:hypothetical protein